MKYSSMIKSVFILHLLIISIWCNSAENAGPVPYLLLLDGQIACSESNDSDNDRLNDCIETNTGIYIDANNTGTNPYEADTDKDGIRDGDEVLGTLANLDLPSLGANPLKKNILLEFDWFEDSLSCSSHSHRPSAEIIERVRLAFANSPVSNPDGTTGIHLIQDYGQGGIYSGGNMVFDVDGVLTGGVNSPEYIAIKNANFSTNRNGYFHYVLMPHRYNTSSGSSGQAELPGDDSIVSLQCNYNNIDYVSNTIMHELGHNLNLRHGGSTNCNYKPNYNSVMNYKYQLSGIDSNDCDTTSDGILSYSTGNRLTLNEVTLYETQGVCGSPPIDWNETGTISVTPVAYNVNFQDGSQSSNCGGHFTVLHDYNDWANLIFSGIGDQDGRILMRQEIITETIVIPDTLLISQ